MANSVIIRDLDLVRVPVLPPEAHPILIVDANTLLPRAIFPQSLQSVRRRRAQIPQLLRTIHLH